VLSSRQIQQSLMMLSRKSCPQSHGFTPTLAAGEEFAGFVDSKKKTSDNNGLNEHV